MAFRQIKAPALANQAVIETKLDVSSVSGQTAAAGVSSLANDTILLHDGGLNALRKLSIANLVNSLSTSNLAEGSNLYFTDARAQAAVAQDIADAVAAEAALRTAADANLQSQIDAEEAARIAADSTLTSDLAAEVLRATTRENNIETAYIAADANLQSQINSILSNTDPAALDSLAEIVAAYQAADDVFTAGIAANSTAISNETTRATNAEAALQVSIDNVQAELDTTQGSIGGSVSALGAWVGYTGTNYINTATSMSSADVLLDSAIKSVESAYIAADLTHSNDILTLQGRMTTAEGEIDTLQADLTQEIADRAAGDAALSTSLQAEIDARVIAVQGAKDYADAQDALLIGDVTVDGSLGNTVTDRIATALASANAYTDTAEADAVTAANAYTDAQVLATNTDLSTETAARIAGDDNLQTQINNILSNTDPAVIDSFTEVVAAFQAADSTLNGLISANQTAISSE
ncbi:MAG TPA: hypothetical protein VLA40_01240, partial [Rheinheimera sp.]|nr:hypothetical protein [Rheinheimera sp.]